MASRSSRNLANNNLLMYRRRRGGAGGPGIRLSALTVAEDATSGTAIGTLSVVNGSGTYTFAIDADPDSKFALNGDGVTLETDATLDYETATSHSVTISADNGVDDPIVRVYTITVTNVFEAATLAALTLDTDEVEETATTGTVVGTLQNVTGGSTLSLLDDAGGRFALDGSDIETTAVSLGAAGASYSITVRETLADSSNSPRDSVLVINVVDVDNNVYLVSLYGQSLSLGATPTDGPTIVSAESTKTITGATAANPVVITSAAHGYSDGDDVFIAAVGGMTQVNQRTFTVSGATTDTFALTRYDGVDVDGSAYSAYTSGGTVARCSLAGADHRMLSGGIRPNYDDHLLSSGNVNNSVNQKRTMTSLVQLRERVAINNPTCGETFAFGMTRQMPVKTIHTATGRAAYPAASLSFDTTLGFPHFSNTYAALKEARNLAVAGGDTISPNVLMIYKQGEADTTTPKATWKTTVQGIKDDFEKNLKHATLLPVSLKFIADQLANQNHAQSQGDLAVAVIEMHRDVDDFYCAGPTYWCEFRTTTDVHFTQRMYRVYGEHLGRVAQSIIDTGDWNPCHITGVSRSGTSITVTVHVPEGSLTTDTTLVSGIANSGFTYSGASITNVSVGTTTANECDITITIDADAGGTLSYAYENGTSGSNGPTAGARGNIRDSSTLTADYDSTPLYNWLCNDQWTVA